MGADGARRAGSVHSGSPAMWTPLPWGFILGFQSTVPSALLASQQRRPAKLGINAFADFFCNGSPLGILDFADFVTEYPPQTIK